MALRPRCLAMCGVLAGKPNDTEFGDVIFADQLFLHDSGKQTENGFQHATRPHKLDIRWLEKARDFAENPGDALAWLERPEWTVDEQRAWLLNEYDTGRSHSSLKNLIRECCPSYSTIIRQLVEEGLVTPGEHPLTNRGRAHITEQRFLGPSWPGNDLPRRSLQIHVGPLASGNAVQADPALWKELSIFARKTLGVEMESHAVGTLAELHQVELAIVLKGVMDHADTNKADRFKPFAARASAECLLAFLRQNLPTKARPGYDDILVSGTAKLPPDPSPSQLLHPAYEVVPFYEAGRAAELVQLDTWCRTGQVIRARLIHGLGGFGKTRLGIQWTAALRQQGWTAGFLHASIDDNWFTRLMALGTPVAIVIDYAESRANLRELLDTVLRYAQADGAKTRVRVLLLARAAGDWWSTLLASEERLRALLSDVPPYPLQPLAERIGTRVKVFQEAVAKFAARRKKPVPPGLPDDLDDQFYSRVLYLHMAALAMVDDLDFRTHRAGRPRAEDTLMEAILDHEERFWDDRQRKSDRLNRLQIERARQLVVAATLRGGLLTREVATSVALSVLGASEQQLILLLHDIYGVLDQQGYGGAYVGPLEPDLLGEGMVRRTYERERERPADFIDRVFRDNDRGALQHGFAVLGRTSLGKIDGIRPWIDRLLATTLEERAPLAFQAAKAVGERTAFSAIGAALAVALQDRGTTSIASAIESSGIPTRTVALGSVAAWAYQTLMNAMPTADNQAMTRERARLLMNLALMQFSLGQRQVALNLGAEAVGTYRNLARRDSGFMVGFGAALSNLCAMQCEAKEWEAARKSGTEAVEIYQVLVKHYPEEFLTDLAGSLANLGNAQSGLGERKAALDSTVQAVQICRELANMNREAFLPDLAGSLNNLGLRQSECEQKQAALDSIAEAAGIYRDLASRKPDTFLPDLAMSLVNLSIGQSNVSSQQHSPLLS